MIIIYTIENNQFIASLEDSQGFKTHFGPCSSKIILITRIYEYFQKTNKGRFKIIQQPWESLMINGIDYGKQLYEASLKVKKSIEAGEYLRMHIELQKNLGLVLLNPLKDPLEYFITYN